MKDNFVSEIKVPKTLRWNIRSTQLPFHYMWLISILVINLFNGTMAEHNTPITLLQNTSLESRSIDTFSSEIFFLFNSTFLCSVIGLLGIVANIINMIVFFSQGLTTSINICFFSMAVSDMFRILFVQWANICFNPYLDLLGAPVLFIELSYITAGWPSGLACRVTLYITVYITAERCMCILFPLTIKTLITPQRTKVAIACINVLNAVTLFPEYSTVYLSPRYSYERNATVLGIAFRNNRSQTQGISFLLHVALVVFGLFSVITLTSLLVVNLKRQTKWRMENSVESKHQTSLSTRDRKSVVMVVFVASSVVISYIPLASVSMVTFFVPEFYISGKLSTRFKEMWAIIFLFGIINSSSNIFIYYTMNSKFKHTFRKLFHNI